MHLFFGSKEVIINTFGIALRPRFLTFFLWGFMCNKVLKQLNKSSGMAIKENIKHTLVNHLSLVYKLRVDNR
jgi:hypothetical protein